MHHRRSVLFIGRYWEERFLAGLADYARKAGWVLHSGLRRSHTDLPRNWRGDGIIANTLGDPELIDYVRDLNVPVVASDTFGAPFNAPMVYNDPASIGRAAAEHLLPLGFRHFAFVANRIHLQSQRAAGFEAALKAAGMDCRRIALEDFEQQLPSLPKPMALMAVNDIAALDAMYIIEESGFHVPRDFALVGVDDDEITCTLCSVPLTSVNLDFEGRGYQCAEILDRVMLGDPPVEPRIVRPIRGVTVRRSTDTIAIPHSATSEALRYIRENYRRPITLSDLENHLGVSVRGVQDLFREHVGRSLAAEISRLRMAAAMNLLANSKLKLEAVARECGYSGRVHLARAIRREKGMSPQMLKRRLRENPQ